MIRLFCNSCNEEYFSYTMPEKNRNNFNSREEENYIPVTWAKYHIASSSLLINASYAL